MTSENGGTPQAGEQAEAAVQQKPAALIAAFIVLSLAGQYFYKLGMNTEPAKELVRALGTNIAALASGSIFLPTFHMIWNTITLFFLPMVLLGLVVYALSAVCWLAILSKVDLSFAYPMISIGYVAILLMGWLVFGEQVSWLRWLGVMLISMGIVGIYSEQFFLKWSYVAAGLMILTGLSVARFAPAFQADVPQFDKPLVLIAVALIMGVLGQIFLKAGMNLDINKGRIKKIAASCKSLKETPLGSLWGAVWNSVCVCLSPRIFGGLLVYVLSTVLWLVLLTKVPLSFLYPLLSVGYILVLLIGWLVFHEQVGFMRWYGVFLICFGIVFIYSENLICLHALPMAVSLAVFALILVGVKKKLTEQVS